MKKLFFFDIDGTLMTREYVIHSQTRQLIQVLAKDPNVKLGIATGRSRGGISNLGDLLPLFENLVLMNGSYIIADKKTIHEQKLSKELLTKIINKGKEYSIGLGIIGLDQREIVVINSDVEKLIETDGKRKWIIKEGQQINVNENFAVETLDYDVYQMWAFHEDNAVVEKFSQEIEVLKPYFSRPGRSDLVYRYFNKASGIQKLQELYPDYQVVCIGDGHNDIEMLKLADIGIAMGNTKYEEVLQNAQLVAPSIEKNQLYDFFKANKLV
ncbi:MAG: HAD family hydrolase ['Conium maculatum' witches'-broom phytoplasma]|nr:HAD family hydrolase ['Conium maculatum' witches'-broom phytoplasma]